MARFGPDKPRALREWLEESREKYPLAYEKFMATHAESLGYYAPWRLSPAARFKPWQTLYRHLDGSSTTTASPTRCPIRPSTWGCTPPRAPRSSASFPYLELAFGVWHVDGGFRALARGMMKCAEDLGATFRLGEPVAQVLRGRGARGGREAGQRREARARTRWW